MDLPEPYVLATDKVSIDGVVSGLLNFLEHVGTVHLIIFGKPMIITSGKDSIHSAGSLHGQGRAVDIRTTDKDASGNELLLHMLAYAATGVPIATFDERNCSSGPHIHLEYHG